MKKKPTVLMILDGYGMRDTCEHNAVCEAKTPIMDQLMSQCPFVRGNASGLAKYKNPHEDSFMGELLFRS